jgi:hypothetical protein
MIIAVYFGAESIFEGMSFSLRRGRVQIKYPKFTDDFSPECYMEGMFYRGKLKLGEEFLVIQFNVHGTIQDIAKMCDTAGAQLSNILFSCVS